MEKFGQIVGITYYFTNDINEIPKNILEKIQKTSGFDQKNEKLIAVAFVDQLASRGDIYVLVTESRVIAKKATTMGQNYFSDITGIERSLTKDIVLLSPGNKSDCFHGMHMPKKELLDKMFEVINNHWMKIRNNKESISNKSEANDIPAQIEKLANLKNQGILTEEEFNKKKNELLSKM